MAGIENFDKAWAGADVRRANRGIVKEPVMMIDHFQRWGTKQRGWSDGEEELTIR
jgi:hypothetical protein